MKHTLQQAMKNQDDQCLLTGVLLMDDVYWGGRKRGGERGRGNASNTTNTPAAALKLAEVRW